MRLEAFRLQNYKKIRDTGWIACEDLMVFVGKNEAGKTALLRGLSKLKPTDGEAYDGIKEFPHSRYTDEFRKEDWPAASGRFSLTKDEKRALEGVCAGLKGLKSITVTRHYSGKLSIEFSPEPRFDTVSVEQWNQLLETSCQDIEATVAPGGQGDAWGPVKEAIMQLLDGEKSNVPSEGTLLSRLTNLRKQVSSKMTEEWHRPILQPIIERTAGMITSLQERQKIGEAEQWVDKNMPYFLYFGNYEVLESAIYLPEFVRRVQNNDKSSKIRVQNALFRHVGVDVAELSSLSHAPNGQGENPERRRKIDELDIKANSASLTMTRKFADWWEQRRHKFTYKFHDDYFRVWVSDDLDATDVELEERSLGMRFFFSFYLLFIVEAEDLHRDCILLLDEPGLHLHGTAQAKLITFLEKVSKDNQLFYSTHSPFMIDGNHLERARAVYECSGGTMVSADVWPRDKDTLFPLQAALGYSVCQSLFLSRKQCLVEGEIDYSLLSVLKIRLKARGGSSLADDIILLPMGGTRNLAPLASLLLGHEIEIALLLDSDPAALGSLKKIKSILADVDARCLQVRDLSPEQNVQEFEDLIPVKYYLSAVSKAYPNLDLKFTKEEQQIHGIVDRLKALFKRSNAGDFSKWLPIEYIIRDINADSKDVPPELYKVAEDIFARINGMLSPDLKDAK